MQNFYFITVANHFLRLCSGVAVELNLQPYIRPYTSINENFEYSHPLIIMFNCCHKIICKKVWVSFYLTIAEGSSEVFVWPIRLSTVTVRSQECQLTNKH